MKLFDFSDGTFAIGTYGSVQLIKTYLVPYSSTFVGQQMLQLLFNKMLKSVSCQ